MRMAVIAQTDDGGIDRWLGEHPLVIDLMIVAVGTIILANGLHELRSGVAYGKRGGIYRGWSARILAAFRVTIGAGVCLVGALGLTRPSTRLG